MSITKKTSEDILKRGNLRGVNAALVTYKDFYEATDDIEARLDDLEDGSITLTTLDLDGNPDALILDADGDTTISAPTDDQIDFELNGADDFRMTANTFTALAGSKIVSADTTDATNKDTGSIITDGGIGVEKSIFVGADIGLTKEVNHNVYVEDSTTLNAGGGDIDIWGAGGNGAGAGGDAKLHGGVGGATGNGGTVDIVTGAGGATSGQSGALTLRSANETGTDVTGTASLKTGSTESADSGAIEVGTGDVSTLGASGAVYVHTGASTTSGNTANVEVTTGNATIGGTGDVVLKTGNTASGLSGDVILETGTSTSATVAPVIKLVNGVQRNPASASVASGGTITAVELVGGHIDATGGTGNWTLPSTANIITALGSVVAGTSIDFIFNASGMTATNTATLVVGADMTVPSAPAITGGATLTVTQDTQVTAGFKIVFDTILTCKIYRMW